MHFLILLLKECQKYKAISFQIDGSEGPGFVPWAAPRLPDSSGAGAALADPPA